MGGAMIEAATNPSWTVVALTLVGGLLTGGVGLALIDWIRNRTKDKVDATASVVTLMEQAAKSLSDITNEAQSDSKEARDEAKAARIQAREAQAQAIEAHNLAHETMVKLLEVRQLAEVLAYRLRRLTSAILDESRTRGELTDMAKELGHPD